MSLFAAPKAVLWPKSNTVDLYLDKSENNIFTLDLNLWQACSALELQSLDLLLKQNNVENCTILIPDDVVYTKTFMYDSEITTIDKAEVIGLAESFINFKINPDSLDYRLIPKDGKTLILAHIYDHIRFNALKTNFESLHLKQTRLVSVSQSIFEVMSTQDSGEYFLTYPTGQNEHTLILSSKDSVYLTVGLKGQTLEVQKTLNYAKLYFPTPVTKFYLPSDKPVEISATTELNKTTYNPAEIAVKFKKPTNLPLPVLGAIINPSMENKKNILPFIAVFVATAAIASIIIWFVLSKNPTNVENPTLTEVTPTSAVMETPTTAPTATPTVAEISKKLKLQVLNATDINGQAATLKEKLTKLGFTSIAVGNSKEKLTENQVKTKASAASASAYFAQELGDFFSATATDDLPASSTYDVVFYIGTDLSTGAAAPTAVATKSAGTATPTKKVTATPTPLE